MARTVTTSEAETGLRSMMRWAEEHRDAVIVEDRGRPRAVIIPMNVYDELTSARDRMLREQQIERLHQLRREVSARNTDLSEDEAMAIADRFAHEIIDDLAREGKLRFERDR